MEKLSRFKFCFILCLSFLACKQTPTSVAGETASSTGESTDDIAVLENTNHTNSVDIIQKGEKEKLSPVIDFDTMQWAEILADDLVKLDIRYATENNFTNKQIYDCPRCFLRPEVAEKLDLFRAHLLEKHKLRIILYDCYRPRPYQQKLWDIVPDERFVGNPAKGSMHNRGMAIDIGLIDQEGKILDMGSAFDHFGPESFHSATNISKEAIENRKLLKDEMALFGFKPITSEWWHYSYRSNVQALSDWVWECGGE